MFQDCFFPFNNSPEKNYHDTLIQRDTLQSGAILFCTSVLLLVNGLTINSTLRGVVSSFGSPTIFMLPKRVDFEIKNTIVVLLLI